ncbi:MAG TPA: carboxypeptidase-like regulatory domain-containing protein, partial [Planctomycetota bacterium]|nr:carboxypeptidase-like regulatory domain-containing protein [Planctomycetota bacterium]
MKGRAVAIALVVAAAAAIGIGLLASRKPIGSTTPGTTSSGAEAAAPTGPAATVPGPAPPAAPAGVIEGIVLRDRKPAPATITARLLHRGPADPDSKESWDALWEVPDLYDGVDPSPRAETAAGPDGRWSFRGLGPGAFHFEARTGDGWSGSTGWSLRRDGSPCIEPGSLPEPAKIELRPAPCVLRGRATNLDGSPFRGFILAGPSWELHMPAPTDADGRFLFDALPEATVTLSALVPGVRLVPGPSVILPTKEEVAFAVGSGREEVEGRVVEDANGAPVAGAQVAVEFAGSTNAEGAEIQRTDEHGRFPVGLFSGGWTRLEVRAAGFLPLSHIHEDMGPAFRRP